MKNKILPIVVIGTLLCLLYIFKKKEDSKIRISKCCKIYETKVSINLDRYYKYKYFYKEKIYKEINEVDELNSNLIGRCFEVLIDPEDPSNSKLNLDKELDCECYNLSKTAPSDSSSVYK